MKALMTSTPVVSGAPPHYDWTYPSILQNHDWDCSEESTRWCLFAYGRTPDDAWMESSMIAAGVISPEAGCLDATGAGLAQWVNDQYGEYGYLASNEPTVSFDAVMAEARTHKHPLAMGGRAFYHWVGVRGYDPVMDRLILANPAPGYKGIYQTMTRQEFENLGGFSMLRVTHPEAESGGGVVPSTLPGGIDVSSHQGYVDWTAVRNAGAAFGWSKATGGAWYKNPTFSANWAGMQAAGLKKGAYHYAFEPSGQPFPGPGPEAEASYFLDTVAPLGLSQGDMLCLDIEEGAGDVARWALQWCEQVEKLVGFAPMLYSGAWFTDQHGFAQVPDLKRYLLWQAAYQSTMPAPAAPWDTISMWQFTDSATVPGVSGGVDGNWFNGSLQDLQALGKPGQGPSPEDPYLPWRGLIGSGILDMMEVDGTLPASSKSTWLPLGTSPADVESVMGQNGVTYNWTVSTTNQGFRYRPE